MDLLRLLLATALLLFSVQTQALFMPEGFTITSESTVPSDEGCGVIGVESAEAVAH